METVRRYIKAIWIALTVIGGVVALLWKIMRDRRRLAYDAEASAAEDEANRVRAAGAAQDDDGVLESFDRATKR